MDITATTQKLTDQGQIDPEYVEKAGQDLAAKVKSKDLKIIDLVKSIDPVLTSGNHLIRLRGVEILRIVITSLGQEDLIKKEIEVLTEFLCLRLLDHKSMEKPVLECFSHFLDYDIELLGVAYHKTLLDFFKTKLTVRKLDVKSRFIVYRILEKIIIERRKRSSNIDSDLLYALVQIIEGENNPENLLLCFRIVSYILKNFQDLEPFIDDIFEWLTSYYPIDYTPNEGPEGVNIVKSDLVNALYDCFYANELNVDNLQTLLLEKLDANLMSTKLESLNCLIRSYESSTVMSIRPYASSLWTFVRVECLKKVELVEPHLLELSYKALNRLAEKLSDDDETFFTFIKDMYEELAIAFKKPEMDLFEPASRLLTHAVLPKLSAVNYLFNGVLPISLNALNSNELRPIPGLTYVFNQLHKRYQNPTLAKELDEPMNKLALKVSATISKESLDLLKAAFLCKVNFTRETQQVIIDKLLGKLSDGSLDVHESLALICLNYGRLDIILGSDGSNCDLQSLVKQVSMYRIQENVLSQVSPESSCDQMKFSVYLRLLLLLFNQAKASEVNDLGRAEICDFLDELRTIAVKVQEKVIENIGRLHAIIFNKLTDENIQPVIMRLISSKFCQELTPPQKAEQTLSQSVYLPVVKWTLKSLVVRNHPLSTPMINLVLNFITSNNVSKSSALLGSQAFNFLFVEDCLCTFNRDQHYQVFALFKQKFYTQTSKEIKIRIASEEENFKKSILATTLAIQIPHLLPAVYRKDYEWLIREILKVLVSLKGTSGDSEANEELAVVLFDCFARLISNECNNSILGLLGSLVDIFLDYAKLAKTLKVRRGALDCLAKIAISFDHPELVTLRPYVINKLKPCLGDKKRLVRQAAAEARLRWVLVGQPNGS